MCQGTHQALDDLEQLLHDHRDALVAEQPANDLEVRRPHEVPEAAVNAGVGQVQGLGREDTVRHEACLVLDAVPARTDGVTAQTPSTHSPQVRSPQAPQTDSTHSPWGVGGCPQARQTTLTGICL